MSTNLPIGERARRRVPTASPRAKQVSPLHSVLRRSTVFIKKHNDIARLALRANAVGHSRPLLLPDFVTHAKLF